MAIKETPFKLSQVELRVLLDAANGQLPGEDRPDLRAALARAKKALEKVLGAHAKAAPMSGRPEREEGGLDEPCPLHGSKGKHETTRLEGKIVCPCGAWRSVVDPTT